MKENEKKEESYIEKTTRELEKLKAQVDDEKFKELCDAAIKINKQCNLDY